MFSQKKAIIFALTKIERKKKDISLELNFVAHPMVPSKFSKSQEKNQLFSNFFSQ